MEKKSVFPRSSDCFPKKTNGSDVLNGEIVKKLSVSSFQKLGNAVRVSHSLTVMDQSGCGGKIFSPIRAEKTTRHPADMLFSKEEGEIHCFPRVQFFVSFCYEPGHQCRCSFGRCAPNQNKI